MSLPRLSQRTRPLRALLPRSVAHSACLLACLWGAQAAAPAWAALALGNNPLYLVGGKANVLMVLDNSNSMDENASGAAVGSNHASSKSEIARGVIRSLANNYQGRVNMGLMAYKQNATLGYYLHNSPYDVSYDPAHYNPAWTGARDSATNKRFRVANPTSAGNFIHYNVALPYYAGSNQGSGFCYSTTAKAFKNSESLGSGPWDKYRCFSTKTGTNSELPSWANTTSEAAKGFSGFAGESSFSPTDSDIAWGILDFGSHNTYNYIGRAWFASASPGRGHLHVPIKPLDATQAALLTAKLACNVPGNPAPCTSTGLQNAGLTPLQGTLLTAKDYFGGAWTTTSEGYTSNCYPLPTSCNNFVILLTDGMPSTDKDGKAVADPAASIAATAAASAALKAAGVETYVIGFALPFGVDPGLLNTVAASGGTGQAFAADDAASLQAAFDAIFDDIARKSASSGALAQSATNLTADNRIFQTLFDSGSWSGEIKALQVGATGGMSTKWSTNDPGHFAAPATRKVFTLKPGVGGVEFKTLADLASTQQAALQAPACGGTLSVLTACAQARIDWLRGERSQEAPSGALRKREKLLGDVIDSGPVFVRDTKTLYVGANDGMLHAFDATTGHELFAYVPNAAMANLSQLTLPAYSHQYFVDGELAVSTRSQTPNKNILVGALGRGGKALYALDVSDPANFTASKVMWEFTDPDLGLVLSKPMIAKLNNGVTAVIVGNGYNSATERAFLFVINLETGALIAKIDTKAGSTTQNNGLGATRGWDSNGDGSLDVVYGGDLLGNLWKFSFAGASPAEWLPAFGTAAAPLPLFVATDPTGGARQPITGGINVGINGVPSDPNFGKLFVFFGTGRFLTSTDLSSLAVQSAYGVVDAGAPVSGRSALKLRSFGAEGLLSGASVRTVGAATLGDMAGTKGWVLDLQLPATAATGERITTEPRFVGEVLYFSSIVPSTNACKPDGRGYLNAVAPFSGASLKSAFFDINKDNLVSEADAAMVDGQAAVVASFSPGVGLPGDAVLLKDRLVVCGTNASCEDKKVQMIIREGRISWREIVRQR